MSYGPIYNGGAGHRVIDTSIAAASNLPLGRLQKAVHGAIAAARMHGATTNEIADRLQIDRGSVQPRTSELKARSIIRDSGVRRLNANGKKAIVWIAVEVRHG